MQCNLVCENALLLLNLGLQLFYCLFCFNLAYSPQ